MESSSLQQNNISLKNYNLLKVTDHRLKVLPLTKLLFQSIRNFQDSYENPVLIFILGLPKDLSHSKQILSKVFIILRVSSIPYVLFFP